MIYLFIPLFLYYLTRGKNTTAHHDITWLSCYDSVKLIFTLSVLIMMCFKKISLHIKYRKLQIVFISSFTFTKSEPISFVFLFTCFRNKFVWNTNTISQWKIKDITIFKDGKYFKINNHCFHLTWTIHCTKKLVKWLLQYFKYHWKNKLLS
jgi:hypothetical protein